MGKCGEWSGGRGGAAFIIPALLCMLAAGCGSKIRVSATGDRSDEALSEIQALVDRKFDED